MDAADELDAIANQMRDVLGRFSETRDSINIAKGDQALFTRLVLEARSVLAERLGPDNDFGRQLEQERLEGTANYLGVQSFHSVEQCAEIARAGANAIRGAARRAVAHKPVESGTPAAELDAIADALKAKSNSTVPLLGKRVILDRAGFAELVQDARSILAENLGAVNSFGQRIDGAWFTANSELLSETARIQAVDDLIGNVRSGAKALRRKTSQSPLGASAATPDPYVSRTRIAELRAVPTSPWDLSRLVRMCEELNSVFAAGNYLATAMLVRAILDHVPPIFGARNFGEYASSIVGKSHKSSMERLHRSHRDIADRWLHEQIERDRRAALPEGPQVDCRSEIDILLGEVVAAAGLPRPAG